MDRSYWRRWRLWLYHRLYAELAWAYDMISWIVSFGQWADWRRLAMEYVRGEQVLEVGHGTGELLLEAAGQGQLLVGMDLSEAMQRLAAAKLSSAGVRPALVRGDAASMPFAAGSFDCIFSAFPAEFILERAVWEELLRLLRPPGPDALGGRLVIVGIVVYLEHPLQRALARALPGGKPAREWRRCLELAEMVGLDVKVEEQRVRWSRVPIVIAERRGQDDARV